jgi:adhesin transport system outer membrane protein
MKRLLSTSVMRMAVGVSVLGCALTLDPGIASGQSLYEAVAKAVATNPEVLAAREQQSVMEERITVARSGFFPTVDATSAYGREYSNNTTTRGLPGGGSQELWRREVGVNVSQPLFDGFATVHGMDEARLNYQAAQHGYARTWEGVAVKTTDAYLETYKQTNVLELLKDNVLLHQKILEKVRQKFESGAGPEADMQHAESRLALTSANHVAVETAAKNARNAFFKIIGEEPRDLMQPAVDTSVVPKTREEGWQVAQQSHPSLQEAMSNLASAEAAYKVSRASMMPRVRFDVSASDNNDVSGSPGYSDSISGLVRMDYNLFRGGADIARQNEARNRVTIAQETLALARRAVQEGWDVAWENFQKTRNRVAFLRKHADVSRKVTDAYHSQFKMGKRTLLDLLNTETELYTALSSLKTEEVDYIINYYRLLGGMGQVRTVMNPVLPAQDSSTATKAKKKG